MSKLNINFNGASYEFDESALESASADSKSHLSSVMNGEGATIDFDGTSYSVDSTKLSNATSAFSTYLGTIAGNGAKLKIGNTEYSVDSTKLSGAISSLETTLSALSGNTPEEPVLEGSGSEYYTLAPTALSFRSTEPLAEFQKVQVNGQTVDPANYTLEEGSTIVKLSIDYLKTLDTGNHEVVIVSQNKTVRGEFSVAAPELNEYGFYYNQPYYGYIAYYNTDMTVIMRNDGTLDLYVHSINFVETGNYVYDGNDLVITTPNFGTTAWTISLNGMELSNNDAGATLRIGEGNIVSDADYIYTYNEELGGYVLTRPFDKNKSSYGAIRTGINGIDTIAIADDAFLSCRNLTSITIPNSIISLGKSALSGCDSLRCIVIPESVTSLDYTSLPSMLESIEVDSNNTVYCSIDNCLIKIETQTLIRGCKNSVIPDSVTSIGQCAFDHCHGLTSITIPNSVTSIGGRAFYLCDNLTNVHIGNGIINIFGQAFVSCDKLTTITFNGTTDQWGSITKDSGWIHHNVPATHIHCIDGDVAL